MNIYYCSLFVLSLLSDCLGDISSLVYYYGLGASFDCPGIYLILDHHDDHLLSPVVEQYIT